MKKGDAIILNVPDNPRLHNAKGKIQRVMEWGAFVKTSASATGEYRAAFSEMTLASEVNSKEQGYSGEICPQCQGSKMVRSGTCSTCTDCGTTSGCS